VIRRVLIVLAALVAIWLAACAVLFVWPSAASSPGSADAIVVLSGGRNSRLDPALALMRRGVAPILVISSPSQDRKWKTARRLCSAHHTAGVPRILCFEAHPYSTRGEARAIAAVARAHDWTHVVVVTSTYHVTRARMLVRRCYDGAVSMVGTSSTWWKLPEEWASETGKLAVQLTAERGC
jgi:uncharacterized SAM-binding protein YcdF (DUF218 family)